MKQPEHRISKSLILDGQKLFQVVGRDVFHVSGILKRSKRIGHIGTNVGHHFVVLIGNGILSGYPGNRVDLVVDVFPFCLIFAFVVSLIQSLDLVEFYLFFGIIQRAVSIGTFKQHVLQVVGQSCVIGRVVFTTCLGSEQGHDPGFSMVFC